MGASLLLLNQTLNRLGFIRIETTVMPVVAISTDCLGMTSVRTKPPTAQALANKSSGMLHYRDEGTK